ncbi:MAG: hypothetical protein LBN33_08725 [Desulfovibrio sp.]|nr:hypothetical protein [Desulfovibrio sp.]
MPAPQDADKDSEPRLDNQELTFTASRSFRGAVRRETAEEAAILDARLAAGLHAGRLLSRDPDLALVQLADGQRPDEAALAGLAGLIFPPRQTRTRVFGFPPHMSVEASLGLGEVEQPRRVLRETLKDLDLMEARREIFSRLRLLLDNYDKTAEYLLAFPPEIGQMSGESQEAALRLQIIINNTKALEILSRIFPALPGPAKTSGPASAARTGGRLDLRRPRAQDMDRLQAELDKALRLAPDEPLILSAMAEFELHRDNPAAAQEYVERALAAKDDYARAHDIHGTALLRRGLPRLAAQAFDRALNLAGKNPVYLLHRASAYLVLEDDAKMCADFQTACSFGDCEGLRWGKESGKCPEPD